LAALEAEDLSELSEEEQKRKKTQIMMLKAALEMEEEEKRKAEQEALSKEAAVDSAQDVAECFSWRGVRFELLVGTIPPRLEDADARGPYLLETEAFFDTFAEAGERWVRVGDLVVKDKCVAYTSELVLEEAREKAGEHGELADLVNGANTAEDIGRLSGKRYHALTWIADLAEEEIISFEDPAPAEGESEEDWDFSL
jgi:hypothetical protein